MRTIKFRAWDKETKLLWKNTYILCDSIECSGLENNPKAVTHGDEDRFEIMQFTGLKDKNNDTLIYEGDFIDMEGNVRGNIYENQKELQALLKKGVDCMVISMETKTWGSTIQKTVRRGCKFAE